MVRNGLCVSQQIDKGRMMLQNIMQCFFVKKGILGYQAYVPQVYKPSSQSVPQTNQLRSFQMWSLSSAFALSLLSVAYGSIGPSATFTSKTMLSVLMDSAVVRQPLYLL